MLRVRRSGDRYVQTIKSAGNSGPFARDEWESEIEGRAPDLRLAQDTALAPLLNGKFRRQLKPVFETRVRRTTYPLSSGNSDIALTLDKGKIASGRNSRPLCEIELELKRGDEAELFKVARELTHALPAQLAIKSKSERGYEMLAGRDDAPVEAVAVDPAPGAATRDGFKAIGLACLKQIIGNEPALLAGDPEGVHQMRVGLRRLRAAISLFADILQDPQTAALKDELKWLTSELGPARELEVLVTRVVAPVRRRHSRLEGISGLSRDLAQQRAAALARAQDAVRSPRFRALTLDIAAWLEAGEWTRPQNDLVRDRGDVAIETSAAGQLTRRFRKIRKQGKKLARLDARSRHKLRIQAKKVRYASEFFSDLFPGKKASRRRAEVPFGARTPSGLPGRSQRHRGARGPDHGHRRSPRARPTPARQPEARLRGRVADRARGRAPRYGSGKRQRRAAASPRSSRSGAERRRLAARSQLLPDPLCA